MRWEWGFTLAAILFSCAACSTDTQFGKLGSGQVTSVTEGIVSGSDGATALQLFNVEVAVGDRHTCARLRYGNVRCWGAGDYGQLGYDSNQNVGDGIGLSIAEVGDVYLGHGIQAMEISAGGEGTCIITTDYRVKCWGRNTNGELGYPHARAVGDGSDLSVEEAGFVDIGSDTRAIKISVGNSHTCILTDQGGVRCWGSNFHGQLGYSSITYVGGPTAESLDSVGDLDLGSGHRAKEISAGLHHTCVILDNDQVKCWGRGSNGRLGNDSTGTIGGSSAWTVADSNTIDLGDGVHATRISAGANHTCAILNTGRIRCWGGNGEGQLGYNNNISVGSGIVTVSDAGDATLPVGEQFVEVKAARDFTCAVNTAGIARCWGWGEAGRLGNNSTLNVGDGIASDMNEAIVQTETTAMARSIASGYSHSCTVLEEDAIRCWGGGAAGRLGYNSITTVGAGNAVSIGDAGDVVYE